MLYIMEWNDSFCKLEISIFSSYIFGHWHRVNYNHFLGIQLPIYTFYLFRFQINESCLSFQRLLHCFIFLKSMLSVACGNFVRNRPVQTICWEKLINICNECKNIYINIFIMIKVKIRACFSNLLKHSLCT